MGNLESICTRFSHRVSGMTPLRRVDQPLIIPGVGVPASGGGFNGIDVGFPRDDRPNRLAPYAG